MSDWKKITLGVAGAFGLLAVLLGALTVLMPRWINGEAVKAGILARVSRAAGGTVVLVTHNSAIAGMADRVLRMGSGELLDDRLQPHPIAPEEVTW